MSQRSLLKVFVFLFLFLWMVAAAPLTMEEDCPNMELCDIPIDGDPVCGVDEEGITKSFISECHMKEYSSCVGRFYVEVYRGPC